MFNKISWISVRNWDLLHSKKIFHYIRTCPYHTFNVSKRHGIELSTRLEPGFSDLRDHRFRIQKHDSLDTFLDCNLIIETLRFEMNYLYDKLRPI